MSVSVSLIGFGILCGSLADRAFAAPDYVAVEVRVTNLGAKPVQCTAELAHWYSAVFLKAAPGATVQADIWSDVASGTVYLLNDKRTPMPVEQIMCGQAGGAGVALPIARRAGVAERPLFLLCDDVSCRSK